MTADEQSKLAYERPKIVDYGTLLELTQHSGPQWPFPWDPFGPGKGGSYPPS